MIKMLAHSSPIAVVGGGGQVPGAVVPLPPPAVGDVAGVQALVLNRSDDCMGGLHRSINCNDDFKHIQKHGALHAVSVDSRYCLYSAVKGTVPPVSNCLKVILYCSKAISIDMRHLILKNIVNFLFNLYWPFEVLKSKSFNISFLF
jgi:hypothetical protein